MTTFVDGGVPTLTFDLLHDVPHGVSTRLGGVSLSPYATLNLGFATDDSKGNVAGNRERFARAVGIPQGRVVTARLTHGNDVTVFSRSDGGPPPATTAPVHQDSTRVGRFFAADAVVSDDPGEYFLLTFADCVPLVFFDRRRGVVGAAHAGWRGTALSIASRVVGTMIARFGCDPADVVAGIGPSIGPCCYSVGPEVLERFAETGVEASLVSGNGGTHLDLWETNERLLTGAGIPPTCIENPRICTSCNVETYFSHRAERGRTGRFGLLIGCL